MISQLKEVLIYSSDLLCFFMVLPEPDFDHYLAQAKPRQSENYIIPNNFRNIFCFDRKTKNWLYFSISVNRYAKIRKKAENHKIAFIHRGFSPVRSEKIPLPKAREDNWYSGAGMF